MKRTRRVHGMEPVFKNCQLSLSLMSAAFSLMHKPFLHHPWQVVPSSWLYIFPEAGSSVLEQAALWYNSCLEGLPLISWNKPSCSFCPLALLLPLIVTQNKPILFSIWHDRLNMARNRESFKNFSSGKTHTHKVSLKKMCLMRII